MTGRDAFAILSPLPLILVCRSIERLASPGAWAWVPAMLVYWAVIAAFVLVAGGGGVPARWFRRPSRYGVSCWLSVGVGVLSLPGFLGHWRILLRPDVLVLGLLFPLVNPLFEEGYWRGLVLDATRTWPAAASVAYSAIAFAVSHPLIWGVQSAPLRDVRVVPLLAVIGALWAMAYRRTGSLWCSAVGHAVCNLLGLSVPLLMGLYSPMEP
jgi:membrane protease YdiL (CAAX protease family)